MKKTDKILIGVVAGVIVLIVGALAISLNQPKADYLPDNTPEGVVNNYLLAIITEDYEKAYGYLSPTLAGFPYSADEFQKDVEGSYFFRRVQDVSVNVESSETDGNKATVTIEEVRFRQDTFEVDTYDREIDFYLVLVNGSWKIVDADSYFISCWARASGCN